MRFSKIFMVITVLALSNGTAAYLEEAEPDTELSQFELDYVIEEYPEIAYNEVAEMSQGELIKLRYTLTNNEELPITVVGLGGAFREPLSGEILVNLTSKEVGPIVINPGDSTAIGQRINLDFGKGNYLLSPQVFVAFKEQLKVIQARPQIAHVKEVPLSIFDPQLLFLEVLFFVISGTLLYFFAPTIFKSQASLRGKEEVKPKVSNFNPAWVPSHHQVTQRGKKTRKAY